VLARSPRMPERWGPACPRTCTLRARPNALASELRAAESTVPVRFPVFMRWTSVSNAAIVSAGVTRCEIEGGFRGQEAALLRSSTGYDVSAAQSSAATSGVNGIFSEPTAR
jgi:hypothetical protein